MFDLKTYSMPKTAYIANKKDFCKINPHNQKVDYNSILLFEGVKGIYLSPKNKKAKFTFLTDENGDYSMILTEFGETICLRRVDPDKIVELHIPLKNYSLMNEDTKFYDTKKSFQKCKVGDIVILKDPWAKCFYKVINIINIDVLVLEDLSYMNNHTVATALETNVLCNIKNNDYIKFKGCNEKFKVKDCTICISGNRIPFDLVDFKTIEQIDREGKIHYHY